jgi:N-alpha-acetyltransferase 50
MAQPPILSFPLPCFRSTRAIGRIVRFQLLRFRIWVVEIHRRRPGTLRAKMTSSDGQLRAWIFLPPTLSSRRQSCRFLRIPQGSSMVQTSITAWLKKAAPVESPVEPQIQHPTPGLPSQIEAAQIPQVQQKVACGKDDVSKSDQPLPNTESSNTSAVFGARPQKLISNVTISPVTADNVTQFQRLITLLLPVPYSDKFFKEIINDEIVSSISLVALWSNGPTSIPRVVSGIRCRLLASSPSTKQPSTTAKLLQAAFPTDPQVPTQPSLYISTIATLSPYRGHGLATALLRQVTARGIEDYDVTTVTAHVWEASEEARAWYAKLGFQEVKFEPEYYRRLRPTGAWLLERKICPSDLLGEGRKMRIP